MRTFPLTLDRMTLVAYTIPAERVRPLLARRLEVDTLATPDGERAVIATFGCRVRVGVQETFLWDRPVRLAGFFTYVRKGEDRGAQSLRALIAPRWLTWPLRFAVPSAAGAVWERDRWGIDSVQLTINDKSRGLGANRPLAPLRINLSGARRPEPPSETITAAEESPDHAGGDVLKAPSGPDATTPSLSEFLAHRTHLYFYTRGHYLWKLVANAPSVTLIPREVQQAHLHAWSDLGLLSPAELARPSGAFTGTGPLHLTGELPRPDAYPWEPWMREEP